MMTQSLMKSDLATIFGVNTKCIVPKQGNWYNPQDKTNSGTWIAFIIREPRPRAWAYDQQGDAPVAGVGSQISTVLVISKVELQIVGPDAEMIAYSVQHWLNRPNVVALFDGQQAQLCADGLGQIVVTNFDQDGRNGVLAYNVSFNLQWANMFKVQETQLTTTSIGGSLTIGA
jgi:hypothetical protein